MRTLQARLAAYHSFRLRKRPNLSVGRTAFIARTYQVCHKTVDKTAIKPTHLCTILGFVFIRQRPRREQLMKLTRLAVAVTAILSAGASSGSLPLTCMSTPKPSRFMQNLGQAACTWVLSYEKIASQNSGHGHSKFRRKDGGYVIRPDSGYPSRQNRYG